LLKKAEEDKKAAEKALAAKQDEIDAL